HRLRRAARRRATRVARLAGGEGRPRLRHLVAFLEADPRRPALPEADAAAHHPPRLPRARPPAGALAPPRRAGVVPLPGLRGRPHTGLAGRPRALDVRP